MPPPGRPPRADDPASGSTRRAPPAAPRAPCTRMPTPTGRPSSTARACWACAKTTVCFSAAKLFFAYGLGNALSFPMSVGATTLLMAERPRPTPCSSAGAGGRRRRPTVFYGAPTGFAGMLATRPCRARGEVGCAWSRRPARPCRRRSASASSALRRRHRRRHRQHRDAAHLPEQPARAVRYGTTGWPVPGYDHRTARRRRAGPGARTANPATSTSRAPARR
jgi:benzoate-CoA ligase